MSAETKDEEIIRLLRELAALRDRLLELTRRESGPVEYAWDHEFGRVCGND